MPRCPLCASARITILISLHPHAFCSNCDARWIQDGGQQRAIRKGPKDPQAWIRPNGRRPARVPVPATTPPKTSFYRTAPRRLPGNSQW
jgi:hypothetical protein